MLPQTSAEEATSRTLSLITAAKPSRCDFLSRTSDSIAEARVNLVNSGWTLEWILVFDGPDVSGIEFGADQVVTLSKSSGIAQARNIALGLATGAWVMPLDADDLIDGGGLSSVLEKIANLPGKVGWVAANRQLLDGSQTPHWNCMSMEWKIGELAAAWTSPFPFHPNSIFARQTVALQVGGWPALPANEDLAWALMLSEVTMGVVLVDVIVRYRVWAGQEVSGIGYPHDKSLAFRSIEKIINAIRMSHGRGQIYSPKAEGAFGILTKDDS